MEDVVAGFACIGPSRNDDAPAGSGELRAIYLDSELWAGPPATRPCVLRFYGMRWSGHWSANKNISLYYYSRRLIRPSL